MVKNQTLQERLALTAQLSKTSMLNEQELFEKRISVYEALMKNI